MLVARAIKGITTHLADRLQEWIFSFMLLALSAQLLRTETTFATGRGYSVLARIASEQTWGTVLFTLAILRISALVVNGTFDQVKRFSPYVRSIGAGVSGVIWMTLSLSILAANPIALGPIVYAGLMVSDMLICVRIAREAGAAERRYRNGCTTGSI